MTWAGILHGGTARARLLGLVCRESTQRKPKLTNCIHLDTVLFVIEIRKTGEFERWLDGLGDPRARARVLVRIERLALGNPGDAQPVGDGVSELRIHYGPGYRVYYKQRGLELIVLLAGGDKRTQAKDIKTALRLARNLNDLHP
jgi:putative addiction module killer protein